MAEDVARAVGADGTLSVTIGGKECAVRPLGIAELTAIERECLEQYKENFLQFYIRHADDFPDGWEDAKKKRDEAARWDVSDLPPKFSYETDGLKVTNDLKIWLRHNIGYSKTDEKGTKYSAVELDTMLRQLTAAALDEGILSEGQYKELTDSAPAKMKVGYVHWWLSGTMEGRLALIWYCFKKYGVTREQVSEALGLDKDRIIRIAREIEHLSTPSVGNG